MEELTAQQEDFLLEQGQEDYYERKEQEQRQYDNAEHITKRCKVCNIATDYNCDEWIEYDYKGSNKWVCKDCYDDLKEFDNENCDCDCEEI